VLYGKAAVPLQDVEPRAQAEHDPDVWRVYVLRQEAHYRCMRLEALLNLEADRLSDVGARDDPAFRVCLPPVQGRAVGNTPVLPAQILCGRCRGVGFDLGEQRDEGHALREHTGLQGWSELQAHPVLGRGGEIGEVRCHFMSAQRPG